MTGKLIPQAQGNVEVIRKFLIKAIKQRTGNRNQHVVADEYETALILLAYYQGDVAGWKRSKAEQGDAKEAQDDDEETRNDDEETVRSEDDEDEIELEEAVSMAILRHRKISARKL